MQRARVITAWFRVVIFTLSVLIGTSALAAPFSGKVFMFRQPDGSEIQVRGWGDEFFATFETLDGYTIMMEPKSRTWCYARVSLDGRNYVSTGVPVGFEDPAALNLRKHLRIDVNSARLKASLARAEMQGAPAGVASRAALPSRPSHQTVGNYRGLCIPVQFPDESGTIARQEIDNYCNQVGYSGFGNDGSVRDYFYDVSNGRLNYTNVVTNYYTAQYPKSYYTDETKAWDVRTKELVTEAVNWLKSTGFDFSQLSADASGNIYALSLFYAGACTNNWAKGLWPHQAYLFDRIPVGGGKYASNYQITNIGDALTIGIFCHESGHLLCDFPDLYDFDYDSNGIGQFCLMDGGGDLNRERSPGHVCGYLKYRAGWVDTVELVGHAPFTASATAGSTTVFRYAKSATEYFIIENRTAIGRDAYLPASGLAIWHADDMVFGNNDQQQTPALHYQCTLIQADGRWDMERNLNLGDGTDLYPAAGNTSFSDSTSPHARWWNGANSALAITNISAPGQTMTFVYGTPATNDPPVAQNQTVTSSGAATPIVLVATDPNGDTLTYTILTQPAHGALSGAAPNVTYTPTAGYSGADSFTFRASDGSLTSNTATVTINVTGVNQPPVAQNLTLTTPQNTPAAVTLTAPDPDGNTLTFSVVTQPAQGTLSGTPPNLTYTPQTSYTGPDSFTFQASDGLLSSNVASVAVTVTSGPDPALKGWWKFDEGTGTAAADSAGTANGTLQSSASWGAGRFGNAMSLNGTGAYASTPSFSLSTNTVTFAAWVNGAKTGDFTGIVYSRRDPQSCGIHFGADNKLHYTWNNDSSATWGWTGGPTIPQNQWALVALVVEPTKATAYVYANGALTTGVNAISHSSQTIDALRIGIDANSSTRCFNGLIDDVRIYNRALSQSEILALAQAQTVNHPPVAQDQTISAAQGLPKPLTLAATDTDGNPLTYSIVTPPAHGTLTGTAPNVTYTGAANYSGADSFTFKANDGAVDGNVATVSITVTANHAPVAQNQSAATAQNTPVAITLAATDIDGNPLTYSIVAQPTSGTLSGAAPNVTYTPSLNFSGADSFTFKANDGQLDSNTATVSLSVTTGPDTTLKAWWKLDETSGTAAADSTGNNYTGTLSGGGTWAAGRVGGALSLNGTDAYVGVPSFTLTTNTVSFVAWVNGAKTGDFTGLVYSRRDPQSCGIHFGADNNLHYTWNNNSSATWGWTGGPAIPQNQWALVAMVIEPTKATAYVYANNTLTSGVNAIAHSSQTIDALRLGCDAQSGRFFRGLIDDVRIYNRALSQAEILALAQAQSVNHAPVAQDQSVTTSSSGRNITLAATDSDGNPLTYSIATPPAHGSLSGSAPTIRYVPTGGYSGSDSFTFKANDGLLDSNTATVSIAVTPNNPPVAQNQSVSTTQGTPAAVVLSATDADGNTLVYSVVASPANGTLSGSAPNLTYTPNGAYTGSDSFTFKANDGSADSNVATVSITVAAGLDPALVAWWKFDETSGTTAADATGHGYSGALAAGASFAAGLSNNAVNLDGTGYVGVGSLPLTTDTITYVAWVNGVKNANWAGIVYSRRDPQSCGIHFGGDNNLHYTWNNNSSATWGWAGGPAIPQNQWAMVAVVIEPTKATAYVYSGGALQSAVNNIAHSSQTLASVRIGGDAQEAARSFRGLIDGVRIYKRALSQAEILALGQAAAR